VSGALGAAGAGGGGAKLDGPPLQVRRLEKSALSEVAACLGWPLNCPWLPSPPDCWLAGWLAGWLRHRGKQQQQQHQQQQQRQAATALIATHLQHIQPHFLAPAGGAQLRTVCVQAAQRSLGLHAVTQRLHIASARLCQGGVVAAGQPLEDGVGQQGHEARL
jgi:hypothetical protein